MINLSQVLSKYEKVNLYLTDKRKIVNAIIYNNKYILCNLYYAANGQAARDRNSPFIIFSNLTPFEKFNFSIFDIKAIEKQTDYNGRLFFGLIKFKKNLSGKEVLTQEEIWVELPNDRIELTNHNSERALNPKIITYET